jgi:hypothetical protein
MESREMTFYMKLQPIEQFEIVAMIAGMCLFFSVILMELFRDREIRIAARALGMIGVVVLGAFGFRMASQCQRLENQIAGVQRVQEVSTAIINDNHPMVRQTLGTFASIITPGGSTISFPTRSIYSDRSMFRAGERCGCGGCGCGQCDCGDVCGDRCAGGACPCSCDVQSNSWRTVRQ